MGASEAFTFPEGRGGRLLAAAEPLAMATRWRTRHKALRFLALGREDDLPDVPLSVVDAAGNLVTRAETSGNWVELDGFILPPETTFYLVAHLRPGDCFYQGTTIASPHPEIVDLGTWTGYPAWSPTAWRPSAGPRNYPANFRFELCASRRASSRAVEILELAAEGQTDKAIAARLGIGESTVEAHWKSLRERRGFASRTEAVAAHLRALAEREREDLEAQRDQAVARAWLHKNRPEDPSLRRLSSIRSWPGWS